MFERILGNVTFLYLQKIENLQFSDICQGFRKKMLVWKGLNETPASITSQFFICKFKVISFFDGTSLTQT